MDLARARVFRGHMAPKIVGRFGTSFCGPFRSNPAEKDEEGSARANWLMSVITMLPGVGGEEN